MKKGSLAKILTLVGLCILVGMMCITPLAGQPQSKEKRIEERPYL